MSKEKDQMKYESRIQTERYFPFHDTSRCPDVGPPLCHGQKIAGQDNFVGERLVIAQ